MAESTSSLLECGTLITGLIGRPQNSTHRCAAVTSLTAQKLVPWPGSEDHNYLTRSRASPNNNENRIMTDCIRAVFAVIKSDEEQNTSS